MGRARCTERISPKMEWWYGWMAMWAAIGLTYFDDCREPCPSCGSQMGMVHFVECAIYDTHCRWCYVPNGARHQPDCDRVQGFE